MTELWAWLDTQQAVVLIPVVFVCLVFLARWRGRREKR